MQKTISHINKYLSFAKTNQFLLIFADDQKSMIEQGKKINTYVKVPVVNSKNKVAKKMTEKYS